MSARTLFVTGAAGAIGSEVTRTARSQGWTVIGLGHGSPRENHGLTGWIDGEVNSEHLNNLAAQYGLPDAVIHLAGGSAVGPSINAPAKDFHRTVSTAVGLLEWLRQSSPDCAIALASSAAVYGDAGPGPLTEDTPLRPTSPYGFHKMMMEQVAASYTTCFNLKCAVLRLFSVYGPGLQKQLVWELCSRLQRGERELRLGGTGAETRDWLHISDAADMLLRTIDVARTCAGVPIVLNGCTGRGTTIEDTVSAVIRGTGAQTSSIFTGQSRRGDPNHLVGDITLSSAYGLAATVDPLTGLFEMARGFALTSDSASLAAGRTRPE